MATQIIIATPPTTDYTIVFPFDEGGKRFDSGFYSQGLTDGRVSIEEINHILAEVESTRRPIASKVWSAVCCYVVSLIAAVVIYVFSLMMVAESVPEFIPFLILIFIGSITGLVFALYKRLRGVTEEMKSKCKAVLDRHNPNFASRGLRWHIPVHFPRWVELWKDYKAGNNPQPIYMPPVNQQPYPNTYGAPNQNMNMGGQPQPQFQQQNYYENYQGQNNNNMYIPPSQV